MQIQYILAPVKLFQDDFFRSKLDRTFLISLKRQVIHFSFNILCYKRKTHSKKSKPFRIELYYILHIGLVFFTYSFFPSFELR